MKKYSTKQITCTIFVVLMIVFNVLMDFGKAGFDMAQFKSLPFWAVLISSNIGIVAITLASRSVRRDGLMKSSDEIKTWRDNIALMHEKINESCLSQALDETIARDNFDRKKKAYRSKIMRKVEFCGDKEFLRKRKEKLEALVQKIDRVKYDDVKNDRAREFDLEHIRIKYPEVRRTTLFSSQSIPHTSSEDSLETAESSYIWQNLIFKRIIAVIAFGVILRGILWDFTVTNPLTASMNAVIKVAQSIWAIYIGVSDGAYFVENVMVEKLKKRNDYLQNFLDEHIDTARKV